MKGSREIVQTWNARAPARRKGIGYIGWAGRGNIGDDAMFKAAQLLVADDLDLLRSLPREKLLATLGRGAHQSAVKIILGGGTLINEDRLPLIEWLIDRGSHLFALGTGVGSAGFSMADESVNRRWAAVLNEFKAIGVRGPLSLGKLRDAGVKNARIIGDLALALTPEQPLAISGAKRMLLNYAPASKIADAELDIAIRSNLIKLINEKLEQGWEIVPMAFDRADVIPLESLIAQCQLQRTIQRPSSFDEYRALAQGASLSIGVRLHSSVFASACGLPNILIMYRDKCRDFAQSIGMEDSLIDLSKYGAPGLDEIFERQLENGPVRGAALHDKSITYSRAIASFAREICAA